MQELKILDSLLGSLSYSVYLLNSLFGVFFVYLNIIFNALNQLMYCNIYACLSVHESIPFTHAQNCMWPPWNPWHFFGVLHYGRHSQRVTLNVRLRYKRNKLLYTCTQCPVVCKSSSDASALLPYPLKICSCPRVSPSWILSFMMTWWPFWRLTCW